MKRDAFTNHRSHSFAQRLGPAVVAGLFLLTDAAHAAAESCCVDDDFAAAFLPNVTYSRSIPDEFPIAIEAPGATLIGSSVAARRHYVTIGWKTESTSDATAQAMADQLLKAGWRTIPGERYQLGLRVGFLPYEPVALSDIQGFCRGMDGNLQLSTRDTQVGAVITLTYSGQNGGLSCDNMIASYEQHQRPTRGMHDKLPALRLPKALMETGLNGSGTSSSSDHASSALTVKTDLTASVLAQDFEEQMSAQGWSLDANVQGRSTVGHVWERTIDNQPLSCMVFVHQGDGQLRMRMMLSTAL